MTAIYDFPDSSHSRLQCDVALLMMNISWVSLNTLPHAEEIIAEEQAGFRAGRSTTEQIFNLRILCEKYLQHQQNL